MKFFILIMLLMFPLNALAQSPAGISTDNSKPIEISAGHTLEWHRNDTQFIARGQVEVKQGNVTIFCETLTADYREGSKSGMDIWRLTAEGNVRILNGTDSAQGEKAVYDIDNGLATLTGGDLKLVSPDQTVTARDRLEYWTVKGEASAIGDAKVIRTGDTLSSDTIKATFKDDAQGKRAIEKLETFGHTVIITPEEKLTGDKGIYHAASNTAELIGNVKIERGPNVLEGERADVNLTTNISRMFGDAQGGGRVRGVFYPDSKDSSNTEPATAPAAGPEQTGY